MNIGGLDCATTSGLTVLKGREFTATTFKASVKKKFLDKDDGKGLDAMREGEIARKFADFLQTWLIVNEIGHLGIEAPLPSNPTRRKPTIDTSSQWAGQAIKYQEVAGTSFAAIFRIYGLEMIAVMVCSRLNIPVMFIGQGTWRKAFLGEGRPADPKKKAKQQCERLKIAVSSLDAAESVGVCWYLDQVLNPYGGRTNDLLSIKSPEQSMSKAIAREKAERLFDINRRETAS